MSDLTINITELPITITESVNTLTIGGTTAQGLTIVQPANEITVDQTEIDLEVLGSTHNDISLEVRQVELSLDGTTITLDLTIPPPQVITITNSQAVINLNTDVQSIELLSGFGAEGAIYQAINGIYAYYGSDSANVVANSRFFTDMYGWTIIGMDDTTKEDAMGLVRVQNDDPDVPTGIPFQYVARMGGKYARYTGKRVPVVAGTQIYAEVTAVTPVPGTAKALYLKAFFYNAAGVKVGEEPITFRTQSATPGRMGGRITTPEYLPSGAVEAEFVLETDAPDDHFDPLKRWYFTNAKMFDTSATELLSASIEELTEIVLDPTEGLIARWGVKIVNGRVVGIIKLTGTEEYSEFAVVADRFVVSDPDDEDGLLPPTQVFEIKDGVVKLSELVANDITTTTIKINANGKIVVEDIALTDRVEIGKIGADYGLLVRDATGKVIFNVDSLGIEVVGSVNIINGAVTAGKTSLASINPITGELEINSVGLSQIIAGSITTTAPFAQTIRPVEVLPTLPSTGNFEGRMVMLTTDGKTYRYHSGAWTTAVEATDLTGQIVNAQIANAAITIGKFASGIVPIEILASAPAVGNFEGRQYFNSTDGKLYRYHSGAWTASTDGADIGAGTITTLQIADDAITAAKTNLAAIDGVSGALNASVVNAAQLVAGAVGTVALAAGAVDASKTAIAAINSGTGNLNSGVVTLPAFAPGLAPVETLPSLPATGNYQGRMVLLSSDNKLYRHTGSPTNASGFTTAVPTSDLSGTISNGQIANGAVTAVKTSLAAIDSTSGNLNSNTVNAAQLVSGAVTAVKTALAAISNSTGNLNSNTVDVAQIVNDAVTSAAIAGGAVNTSELASGAVTAIKTTLAAIDATSGGLNINTVNTAQVVTDAITSAQILAGSVGTVKLANNAVIASKLYIGDPSNLIMDVDFTDTTYWTLSSGSYDTTSETTTTMGLKKSVKTPVGNGTTSQSTTNLNIVSGSAYYAQIEAGKTYRFHADTYIKTGFTGLLRIVVNWYTQDGTTAASTASNSFVGTDYRTVASVGNVLGAIDAQAAAPANAYYARYYTQIVWSTTLNNAQYALVGNPRMHRAASGELIVDGAITAAKIVAGTITGDRIAANTIYASRMVLTDSTNGILDIPFADTSYWATNVTFGSYDTTSETTTTLGIIRSVKTLTGNGTTSQTAGHIIAQTSASKLTVEAGKSYRAVMSTLVKAGFTGRLRIVVLWYKQDNTASSTPNSSVLGVDYRTVAAVGDAVATVDGILTAPSDAYYANFAPYLDWSTTLNNAQYGLLGNFRWHKAAGAELVVDGSITAAKLVAGIITAGYISAGAITATKLLISDTANMIIDSNLQDTAYWSFSAGGPGVTINTTDSQVVTTLGARSAFKCSGNGTTSQSTAYALNAVGQYFTVEPGKQYRVVSKVHMTAGFTGRLQTYIQFYQDDGTTFIANSTLFGGTDYRTVALVSATTVTLEGITAAAPSDAYYARFVAHYDWSTTLTNAGSGYFSYNKVQRANAGDLTVDGTITGAKIAAATIQAGNIAADTITAGNIAAGAITSSELAAGAVIAGKITAGTIVAADIAVGAITGDRITANSINTSRLTITNFNNLIPNPDSEITTSLTGSYENAGVYNAGGGNAYTGSYVRRLNAGADQYTQVSEYIPCVVGDEYYFEAWAKKVSGTVSTGFRTLIVFFAADKVTQPGVAPGNYLLTGQTTYAKTFCAGAAPATTAYVAFFVNVITAAACDVYFDGLYAGKKSAGELIVDGVITAAKIQALTITGAQIAADAITSAKILAGTIVASDLAAGTITANEIATGTLTAGLIAAGAITASKLFVGDTSNAIIDPLGSDAVYWVLGVGWTQDSADAGWATLGYPRGFKSNVGNGVTVGSTTTYAYTQPSNGIGLFPVEGGKPFRVSADFWLKAGYSGYAHIAFNLYKADGSGATTASFGLSCTDYRTVANASSNVQRLSSIFTPSQDAVYGRFHFGNLWSGSLAQAQYFLCTNARVTRANAGDLTVDGSITAAKITAGTITGNEIAADAITSAKILAGTIVASDIASATITSAQIAAGTIVAGNIAAGAITASKLLVSAFENLIPNGDLRSGNLDGFSRIVNSTGTVSVPFTGTGWPSAYALLLQRTSNSSAELSVVADTTSIDDTTSSGGISTQLNDEYYFECQIYQSVASACRAELLVRYSLGAAIGNCVATADVNTTVTSSVFLDQNVTVNNFGKMSGTFKNTLGAGKAYLRLWNASATNGVVAYYWNMYLKRRASGSLIVDGAITAAKITALTITGNEIAAATIAASKIVLATITDGQIAATTITGGKIATGTITAANMVADTLTAGTIAAGAIGVSEIAAGAVRTDKLFVTGRGKALNADPACMDPSAWVTSGAGSYVLMSGATPSGNTFIRTTNGTNFQSTAVQGVAGTTYKLSFQAKQSGTGVVYGRVICYDTTLASNLGFTVTNLAGGTFEGLTITGSYAKYTGYIVAPASTAWLVIQFHMNWGGTGSSDITDIRLEEYIGADLIVDGAISAVKILSATITTSQIAAGTITASNIATDTITAGQIAAGAIGASEIAAGAVIASKVTISDFTNLLKNDWTNGGSFDGWIVSGNSTLSYAAAESLTAYRLACSNYQFPACTDAWIPVDPGYQYYISAYVYSVDTASANVGIFIQEVDETKTNAGNVSFSLTATKSAWVKVEGVYTAATNKYFARFYCYSSSSPNNYNYFSRPLMRRMASGNLIVDGAITALKIFANTITAAQIAAGTITADRIAIGLGGNKLPFATPAFDSANGIGSYISWDPSGQAANYTFGRNDAASLTAYCPPDSGGQYIFQTTSTSTGSPNLTDFRIQWRNKAGALTEYLPCEELQYYELSCYIGNQRGQNVFMGIAFYDASGTYITETGTSAINYTGGAGGTKLADYTRCYSLIAAPSGTRSVAFWIRRYNTQQGIGAANSITFWVYPQFKQCTPYATGPAPWEAPGVTTIDGGQISADTIRSTTYNSSTKAGWILKTNGVIEGNQINIYNTSGVLQFSAGGMNYLAPALMPAGGWRWQLAAKAFLVSDGDTITYGIDLVNIPTFQFSMDQLDDLASGEIYKLYVVSASSTSAVATLKIATPGTTTGYSLTSMTTGTTPKYYAAKGANPDANGNTYNFNVSGQIVFNLTTGVSGAEPYFANVTINIVAWKFSSSTWTAVSTATRTVTNTYTTTGTKTLTFSGFVFSANMGTSIDYLGAHISTYTDNSGDPRGSSFVASINGIASISWSTTGASGTRTATPSGEKSNCIVVPV